METLFIATEKNLDNIIKLINGHRLSNKNRWWQVKVYYNGYEYKIKAYNTWIQIFRREDKGIIIADSPSPMDISVGQFKEHLRQTLVYTVQVQYI